MVTIANAVQKVSAKGNFITLELMGDVELVQSMASGRFYATAKRCSITCTFTEAQAKSLIGTQLPGTVVRIEADPYDYTVPETGEVIKLSHTYTYMPPQAQVAEKAINHSMAMV